MYKLPEGITTKLNELFEAINKETDDLKMSAAEASLNGDFSQITVIKETFRKLQELEINIKSASESFTANNRQRLTVKKDNSKNTVYRTRKPGGHIQVEISGKVIEKQTIADTFVEVLKVFGLSNVEKLNKVLSSAPLIAKIPTANENGYPKQIRMGDWYITTHVNKKNASRIIEEISNELSVPVHIKIVER